MTYLELAPVIDTVYAIAIAVILFAVVRYQNKKTNQ
jgi:hypothetical protein